MKPSHETQANSTPDRPTWDRACLWCGMLGLLVALSVGCGQPADERSAVISGKVTLGGAPLEAGSVLFMTADGHAASENLAIGGTYTVRCRPGRYQVAVTPPPAQDPLGAPPGAAASQISPSSKPIPKRYHELGSSGLTVEAKMGNNTYDISLTW